MFSQQWIFGGDGKSGVDFFRLRFIVFLSHSAEHIMTDTEFQRLAALGYNRIPVTLNTFADLDTPLSIYLKLANKSHSYLLESVIGGERFGRYSIIGLPAREWLEVRGRECAVVRAKTGGATEKIEHKFVEDPLAFVEK